MSVEEIVLTNARLVLKDAVVDGTIVFSGDKISDIQPGRSHSATAQDMEQDWIIPGLVELHTDNMERHLHPRPGVNWPAPQAIIAHDREVIAAGITTVLDALRVGVLREEKMAGSDIGPLMDGIDLVADEGLLRADHYFHLRCEVCCEDTASDFIAQADHDRLRLVSIMDHTPGQRQFSNIEKYKEYYGGKYGLSGAQLEALMQKQMDMQQQYSASNRQAIVAAARSRGVALASHDDATAAHVSEAASDGMHIAEFPTSVEAAAKSQDQGMGVLMGAPNVCRGGSHSGNVSALDLAARGHLDILSSDYIPASLVQAAFILSDKVDAISVPQAVATVSAAPAQSVGLTDRGQLAPGLRADAVRIRSSATGPIVHAVWAGGAKVV